MFMIMPKSASQPQGQQRLAGRPARVKAACDRCRHKKIKVSPLATVPPRAPSLLTRLSATA